MNNFDSIRRIVGASLPTVSLFFAATPALAEEPPPAPSGVPSAPGDPSPQEAELRALNEQGKLEAARERNREDAERRHERRELERAKYETDLARYRRMRETYMEMTPSVDARERSTRDALLQRRLFLPDLVGFGFSTLGQGGLGGSGGGLVSGTAITGSQQGVTFTLGPNVDVRIGERLTVGGSVTFSRTTMSETDETAVRFNPRIGVLVPAGPVVVWPRIGPTFGASDGTFFSGQSIGASLEVGLVVPLTSRVFVQATPSLTYSHVWFSHDNVDMLGVGVRTGLGIVL